MVLRQKREDREQPLQTASWNWPALTVPVLTIITGEGGSGGALALAAGDQVWMLENAVYSILSPEGFSSILWKDSTKAKEAAEVMKLTAADLYSQGIIEKMICEPEGYSEPDTLSGDRYSGQGNNRFSGRIQKLF